MADKKITELTEATTVISTDIIPIVVDVSTVPITKYASVDTIFTDYLAQSTVNGRLTLESGVPISSTDQSAKTTVYFTPYMGNKIGLYDGTYWKLHSFTERSLSLAGYTADKNYDIFIYDNAGTITLESVIWTNDTTRATALASQDGIYVKTGATNKRYLGTIRINSAGGQCEDTVLKRFVWNMYNRVLRPVFVYETTDSWTYTDATWRAANNSAANRIGIVVGLPEDTVDFFCQLYFHSDTFNWGGATAVGEDVTNAPTAGNIGMFAASPVNNINVTASSRLIKIPASVGYHYYAWLELGSGGGHTATMYGDAGGNLVQSGMNGAVKA